MATRGKRRAFGQHFLKNKNQAQSIAEKAVNEAIQHHCKTLLEIGPGKGALTYPLLDLIKIYPQIGKLILSERDRELVQRWRIIQGATPSLLQVEEGDFLKLPEEYWLTAAPLIVISNLPYSTGTAILTRLARYHESIPSMILMFQAEVAKKLRAPIATQERGSLSVWIQNHWEVKKLLSVSRGAFSPPPGVDSEVVLLSRLQKSYIPSQSNEILWESLLKICFAHRRKMIRSNLTSQPDMKWRNILELSQVDGTRRAEALSWNDWTQLYQAALQLFGGVQK